jgi:7-keto-8-aminopelargonate synthetase-like enzyme
VPLGPELQFVDRTKVLYEGRPCLFFGSSDYHRLSSHPDVLRAVLEACAAGGLRSGGSRTTTGNHPYHVRLEADTATFLGREEAATCANGYLSNTVALEATAADFQRFFLDDRAHASVKVSLVALPADRVHRFRHCDPEHLRQEVEARLRPGERPLVLTDGVEFGTGEIPPLAAYWEIVRNVGGRLMVDDSHGLGVVGPTGKGAAEEAGLPAQACILTGSYAKAFGVFGGLLAGSAGLFAKVVERSRTFTGATPLPPHLAAAALRSIGVLREHPEMIAGLRARTFHARARLRAMGLPSCDSPAPILSVTHLDERNNQHLLALLLRNGIYPTFNNYPGCPPGGHFRFALSSLHSDRDVELLLEVIGQSCG